MRTLLVVIALLLGVVAALLTGILTTCGGAPLTTAVLSGGGAFAAMVPLALLIERELGLFADRTREPEES